SQTPPTFQTVIDQAPVLDPFLKDTAGLFRELRPGFARLHESAPVLTQAEIAGVKNLPATTSLDQELTNLAQYLQVYGQNPVVQKGLERLTLLSTSLRPPLQFLTPVQSSCNYVT